MDYNVEFKITLPEELLETFGIDEDTHLYMVIALYLRQIHICVPQFATNTVLYMQNRRPCSIRRISCK